MALTLAPSHNQPTVTSGSLSAGAAASTVIATSLGWLREKRIGAAETAAGASQTSTANLDLTGSSRYRYPAVPAAIAYASNAANYTATDLQPGAIANSHWPFCVELVTSSPTIAFRYNAPASNPSLGRILVDGLPITDTVGTATATAGSGYYVLLTFPDSRARTITVIGGNANQGRWGGCAVASGHTITKPTDTLPMLAVIADSYGRGAGTVGGLDTCAWRLAWELGYGRSVILATVGGTGVNYDGSGGATASFDGRVSTVMSFSPEAVLILGGRNDTGNTALQTALEALLDSIGSTPLRVVASTASESGQATVRSYMSGGASSRSVAYIDTTIDALPKLDSVHPTQDGHKALAAELLAEWPASAVTGTATVSAPAPTASGAGSASLAGAGAVAAPAGVGSAAGAIGVAGAAAIQSAAADADGQGAVRVAGQATVQPTSADAEAQGTVTMTGQAAATVADATASISGAIRIAGSAAVTAPVPHVEGADSGTVAGEASVIAPAPTGSAQGGVTVSGAAAVAAGPAQVAAAATISVDETDWRDLTLAVTDTGPRLRAADSGPRTTILDTRSRITSS